MANSLIKLSERSSAVRLWVGQIFPPDFFVRNTVEGTKSLLGRVFLVGLKKSNQIKADLGLSTRYRGISRLVNGISLQWPLFRVLDDGFTPTTVLCSERAGGSRGKSWLWRFFMAESLYESSVKKHHQVRKVKSFG